MLTSDDLDNMLDAFDPVDVTVRLQGVLVKTVKGVVRKRTEYIGQSGQIVILPSITCKASDLADVMRLHTFEIDGQEYKAYGDQEPRNSGLARVGLVKR